MPRFFKDFLEMYCDYRDVLLVLDPIFSLPEPKAQGELIGWDLSRPLSVCLSVCPSVHTFKHKYL